MELIMNHSTSSPPRLGKTTYKPLWLILFLYLLNAHYITLTYHYSACHFPNKPKWDKVFCKKHCRTSKIVIITLFFKAVKVVKTQLSQRSYLVITSWRIQLSQKLCWQCVNVIFISVNDRNKYVQRIPSSSFAHSFKTIFLLLYIRFTFRSHDLLCSYSSTDLH